MDRRAFLKLAAAGSVALGSLDLAQRLLAADPRPAHRHWTWLRHRPDESMAGLQSRMGEIRAAGIGSILLDGATAETCALAAAEGLDVHTWTWALCRGGTLLEEHPDWYVVNREGKSACDQPPYVGYYHFLCPSRPEVRRYLGEEIDRIVSTEGLRGVHLDYIRYPDVILPRALWRKYGLVQDEELPPFDFCYCDVCRQQFRQRNGRDPLELPDPSADKDWRRFRWDSITTLVNELAARIHRAGKLVSAAVFPSPAIARRLVRQDWPAWDLDAVLPMVYNSFYEEDIPWIEDTVRQGVQSLPAGRSLYAGLYLPALSAEGEFEQAAAAALAGGAAGLALFGGVRDVREF